MRGTDSVSVLGASAPATATRSAALLAPCRTTPPYLHEETTNFCYAKLNIATLHLVDRTPPASSIFFSATAVLVGITSLSAPDDAVLQYVDLHTCPSESHDRTVPHPVRTALQRHPAGGAVGTSAHGKGVETSMKE